MQVIYRKIFSSDITLIQNNIILYKKCRRELNYIPFTSQYHVMRAGNKKVRDKYISRSEAARS
jgi:hypothetical protein